MRCEVCWMICVLFRVSVSETVLHPRFQPCSPDSSCSPVHRIRLRNRSLSPSPKPFSVSVTSIVLRPRSPSEPYRDAFAASDADVDETGGVGRELIAVKIPCNAS